MTDTKKLQQKISELNAEIADWEAGKNDEYNGWTNWETWRFALSEGSDLTDSIQDYQNDCDKALEYGQVFDIVKGHIDNLLDIEDLPTVGIFSEAIERYIARVDIHQITSSILLDLEVQG